MPEMFAGRHLSNSAIWPTHGNPNRDWKFTHIISASCFFAACDVFIFKRGIFFVTEAERTDGWKNILSATKVDRFATVCFQTLLNQGII